MEELRSQRNDEWALRGEQRSKEKRKKLLFLGISGVSLLVVVAIGAVLFQCKGSSGETPPEGYTSAESTESNQEQIHTHTWEEATCTMPRVCAACGLREGSPLGHNWTEATCSAPTTCVSCGMQEGVALEHTWTRATFLTPQTCTVCGQTKGSPIPYQDLNVEQEVTEIREEYNAIQRNIDSGYYSGEKLRDGVTAYYVPGGELRSVHITRGTDGIGDQSGVYRRYYYFSNGELIFAYYEGQHCQRFYFYEGCLMRWRYTENAVANTGSVNHDLEFSQEYFDWETMVLAEAATLS